VILPNSPLIQTYTSKICRTRSDPFYEWNRCASGYNDISRNGIDVLGVTTLEMSKTPKNLKI
jgi:hypothetical protein